MCLLITVKFATQRLKIEHCHIASFEFQNCVILVPFWSLFNKIKKDNKITYLYLGKVKCKIVNQLSGHDILVYGERIQMSE